MQKQQKFHHSISEEGNLQLRILTEYQDDEGKVLDKKYSDPMAPADTSKMDGFDDRSKDIVITITDSKVKADFAVEKQTKTGQGLEQIVSYDRTLDDLGRISVRRITRIFDEGEEVSKKYHRSWIMPGDDASKADVMSKAVANKIHTQAIIDAYNTEMIAKAEEI